MLLSAVVPEVCSGSPRYTCLLCRPVSHLVIPSRLSTLFLCPACVLQLLRGQCGGGLCPQWSAQNCLHLRPATCASSHALSSQPLFPSGTRQGLKHFVVKCVSRVSTRTRHHLSGVQPPQAEMSCSPLFTRTVAVSRPLHRGFPGASPAEIARHVTVGSPSRDYVYIQKLHIRILCCPVPFSLLSFYTTCMAVTSEVCETLF